MEHKDIFSLDVYLCSVLFVMSSTTSRILVFYHQSFKLSSVTFWNSLEFFSKDLVFWNFLSWRDAAAFGPPQAFCSNSSAVTPVMLKAFLFSTWIWIVLQETYCWSCSIVFSHFWIYWTRIAKSNKQLPKIWLNSQEVKCFSWKTSFSVRSGTWCIDKLSTKCRCLMATLNLATNISAFTITSYDCSCFQIWKTKKTVTPLGLVTCMHHFLC